MVNMQYSLGIDLGGSHIAAALVDEEGRLLFKKTRQTDISGGVKGVAADIGLLGQSLLKNLDHNKRASVEHVGVGVPGPIHPETRKIISAPNLGWEDVDLFSELVPYFPNQEIHIVNDATCAAWAEYKFGALQDYPNSMLLTLGTGLGGGLIYRGQVFDGGNSYGFEPGHTILVADGELCSCGRRGCLEAYVSVKALRREADKALKQYPDSLLLRDKSLDASMPYTIRELFAAAAAGDPAAKYSVDLYVHYLAIGIASFVVILQPEIIALGGGISHQGTEFYTGLQEAVARHLLAGARQPVPPVIPAKLGNDAGIVGAAISR